MRLKDNECLWAEELVEIKKEWAGLALCLAEAYSKYLNPLLKHPCTALFRASKKLFITADTQTSFS